jgi:hypothetical protein
MASCLSSSGVAETVHYLHDGQVIKLSPHDVQVCSNLPVLKKFSAAELQSGHDIVFTLR